MPRGLTYLIGTAVVAALLLAACGKSASQNGAQACSLAEQAIRAVGQSASASTPSELRIDRLLTEASQLANLAAAANGGYQPLAATLAEASRVPAKRLVPALRSECGKGASGLGAYIPPSA